MIEEILTRVRMAEMDAVAAKSALVLAARQTPPAARTLQPEAPAGRRMLRVVAELDGGRKPACTDPALYSRLAWSGLDGD